MALAISISVLLRRGPRRLHLSFAAFSAAIGFWYLAQSFLGLFQAPIWQRFTAIIAVLVPHFAINLFEGMVPAENPRSRLTKWAWVSAIPMLLVQLSPFHGRPMVRAIVFFYVFSLITLGLYQLGQRGAESPSRATQRRVRFLVVIGAMAGFATTLDFVWFLGARTPPIGAVLVILFVFALSQSLRYERILDLYEMLGRLLVAVAVAFLIAGIFYVLLTFLGGFNTMYLNAVLAATVLLVVFEPLQARVEEGIQKWFFRERFDFEGAVGSIRRRLSHTLEVNEMSQIVISGLEQSRRATCAALFLREPDGAGFERIGAFGSLVPQRIEVATARAVLERLETGSVVLEQLEAEARDRRTRGEHAEGVDAVLAAAEVLGGLKQGVWVAIWDEQRELIGILGIADDRVKDGFSSEEVALLEQLATQVSLVVENSRVYGQLKEKDRLAVLGQMAAGLAHEIRNPLGAIKGAAQLLAEPGPAGTPFSDDASREFIGIILEEVERLNRVVGNVLDLARPSEDSVMPIDVNAVVRRTLQILSAEPNPDGVELVSTLAQDLPRVAVDPEQLRQVLMNLVRNALQAVAGRGRVNVSTRIRFGRGTRSGRPSDGTFVEIHVADTGPGMSQSTLEKIFLPFFTTRERGTGLGLAISQRIAQGAGGRIDVRSYEGKGSTFTVVLPSAMDALGTPTPAPVRAPSVDSDAGSQKRPAVE